MRPDPKRRPSKRDHSLLGQIERDAVEESVSVASALRKCITLGGRAGSADLRAWAARGLRGYGADDDLPPHCTFVAAMLADGVTIRHRITGERISVGDLTSSTVAVSR
jgi:hypothetical protein